MLAWIVAASIRHRIAVLLGVVVLITLGVRAFMALPIDAVPDLTNVQVQVLTAAPSLGALDVERLVSAPVEMALSGIPEVQELRSLSRYGVSAVTVVFNDDVDAQVARNRVNERMPRIRGEVAAEIGVPEMGPLATGLGEVYQFEVRGEGRSPMELRSILDWQIAPRLRLVPGVIDVNVFGGELRTYEVTVDPQRMAVRHVALGEVITALERNHVAVGGGAISRGPEGLLVRGDAMIRSLDDLGDIVVSHRGGAPIYVRDVASTRFAPMLRQGAATRDGRGEVVVGMTLMLLGDNSRVVSRAVGDAVRLINPTLPPGVRIDPFYDRTTLVERTLSTVSLSLVEGGLLVVVVLFLMLRNLRAGLVAAAMIPLCMLSAFIGMRALGISGNLMSLGAIDFGLVVDGAIILLENAVHHLAQEGAVLKRPLTREERDEVVLRSALEVRGATAFGEVIIALVYLPVLTLQGIEGKTFQPMALTVLFALAGAFVLSLTFVPALASLLLPADAKDLPSPIVTAARWAYEPALRATLRWPAVTLGVALLCFGGSMMLAQTLGSEFVPQLNEGAIIVETVRQPSTGLAESVRQSTIIERVLRRFPEVTTVVSKTGRPEIANDPMGVEQSDVLVMLRPEAQILPAAEREALITRMHDALTRAVPGVGFGFTQPIQMRMNELLSGVRADVAVKVYGDDLPTLARLGAQVARALRGVRGATDLRTDRVEGMPVLRATIDRHAAARLGADAEEALAMVEAIGGRTVGSVLEGRQRYPLRVRLPEGLRDDVEALRRLPVHIAGDATVPLRDVAQLEVIDEPVVINREALARRLVVQTNVRGRDLGGFAEEAQRAVRRSVRLPPGYRLEWGGQFENLERAKLRLAIVVPLALGLILALLYMSFRSVGATLLIFANVPFAATGGIVALWSRGLPLSLSASVGFIALFGVAVLNGLVLVTQIRQLREQGSGLVAASREGALRRLRPVLTTALVASLGFVPMAITSGAGSEVQRPLATVVIGGLVSSTLLTLLVLPTLYAWLGRVLGPKPPG
ncbi:MAG: efflux RND transporter permease subunit [Deltaproteobacteria bacterium]|nr:efflux RND transporter permease subunit [Deltaproteobacteria bacterium]